MAKKVVVIASGETERQALPLLLRDATAAGVEVVEVRKPSGHRDLDGEMAANLILAAWFRHKGTNKEPEKIVVLLDADGEDTTTIVETARLSIERRVRKIRVPVLVATAQWHLEAWFFADAQRLRAFLGRKPGKVDTSRPDEISNPKRQLISLLGGLYTARVAGNIAEVVRPSEMRGRSPSFADFETKVKNGPATATSSGVPGASETRASENLETRLRPK